MLTLPSVHCTDASGKVTAAPFAVPRIICIARNYDDHAVEMGHAPSKEPPFYFFKPLSALNTTSTFVLPTFSNNVQHELELVVGIGQGGSQLSISDAKACVAAFGLGLDMTARDLQQAAKTAGRPWDLAKGFDGSAKLSTLVREPFTYLDSLGEMTLRVNGDVAQRGHWQKMVWSVPELLVHLSESIALLPGDLVYTGTPAGVGPVKVGDKLTASMAGFPHALDLTVM